MSLIYATYKMIQEKLQSYTLKLGIVINSNGKCKAKKVGYNSPAFGEVHIYNESNHETTII